MFIKDMIKREIKMTDWLIGHAEKDLEKYVKLPERTLVCEVKGAFNLYYYAQYHDGSKQVREYLGKPDDERVRQYKVQKFLRETLKVLYKNKEVLEKAYKELIDPSPQSIHRGLPSAYKNLPDCCYVDEQFEELKEWAAEKYERNPYPLPVDPNVARDGTVLRSKGECMIYDNILFEDIPVRVDPKIKLRGKSGVVHSFCPDFLFSCKDGSSIIMEHFGKLYDDDYAKENLERIQKYLDCGYVLGDNLIVTSDNIEHNTNELMILDALEKIKKRMS